jgi:tetratricopeptide (TPR) repeat protein
MSGPAKHKRRNRWAPTLTLAAVVLLATWVGDADGGYFAGGWSPVALLLAALLAVLALAGLLRRPGSGWEWAALLSLAAYAVWTFASMLWAANKGSAWAGSGQTLLYLLAFWLAGSLISAGASRRWVMAVSVAGPAAVAALTLLALPGRPEDLLPYGRLLGTVGYSNGEAAFVLMPFWAAVYLGGSRCVNPVLRGVSLAGATLALEVAVLTQSRGAAVALALSLPVFFLLSGQRLRGLLALAPAAAALAFAFPELNAVYAGSLGGGDSAPALESALPTVWTTVALAGLYGLLRGLVDRLWRPPEAAVRLAGWVAIFAVAAALVVGGALFVERAGNPVGFAAAKWEAFKTDDSTGQEGSRYLSASGSGRYVLWQAALAGFREHPVIGVGANNYEAVYYQERERYALSARQPHSLPLEILAEKGLVGAALFSAFLVACLGAGLRQRFGDLTPEGRAQVGALVAAVAYWFVHSGAEWFWQLPAVTLPAVVYLAMLVTPWQRGGSGYAPVPLRTAAAVVGALAVAATAPLYVSDLYLQRSYAANSPQAGLSLVERAQAFDPLNPRLREREAALSIEAGDYARAKSAYAAAIRLNPDHYEDYMYGADLYKRRGELGKALDLYREALSRNPKDPKLREEVKELRKATGKEAAP